MNSPEVSPSSSQEGTAPGHQSHQQGSSSGSDIVQAEAQDHSPESVYDSDVLFMGETSAQGASQVDHDDVGDQIPRRSTESPRVFETSTRRPRGRQQPQEGRHGEGSRAFRFEGRIYNEDRSRSPPLDRRSSRSARPHRSRRQRRHSQGDESGDDFSGTNRSLNRFLQMFLLERRADVVIYCNGENVHLLPKGFKTTFHQKSTVFTPMGTNWK